MGTRIASSSVEVKTMKIVSVAAVVGMSLSLGCSSGGSDDGAPAGGDESNITAGHDDLFACKKVLNGTGSIHVFEVADASKKESKDQSKQVVSVGFSGKLNTDTVGYSQGDQPDLATSKKDGDVYEMKFLQKKCAGQCDNFLTLSDGQAGENEGVVMVHVELLRIDTKKGTAHLEGTKEFFGAPGSAKDKAFSVDYDNCDMNKKLIDGVHDRIK
jgi:hypothetical protein